MVKKRLVREDPELPLQAELLRGGLLTEDVLRQDALDNYAFYGFYGVSAWLVSDEWPAEQLQATKLRSSERITVVRYADLRARGLTALPTGQAPHQDIATITVTAARLGNDGGDLQQLVAALLAVEHTVKRNAHYVDPGEKL